MFKMPFRKFIAFFSPKPNSRVMYNNLNLNDMMLMCLVLCADSQLLLNPTSRLSLIFY
jgi:hypothetical protein